MKTITSTELNRSAGAMLKLVESGETVEITKNGRVVAVLTPPSSVVGKVKRIDPPLEIEGAEEVDDWGLPIDYAGRMPQTMTESVEKPAGMEMGTSKKDSVANAKKQRDNFAEAGGGEPKYRPANPAPLKPWKSIGGLSKSQQAGGKYDR